MVVVVRSAEIVCLSILLISCWGVLGCASSDRVRYEVVNSVQMEKQVIEAHPTYFRTSFDEGGRVWERALLASSRFFEGNSSIESSKKPFPETKMILRSKSSEYTIIQRLEKDGFFFAVEGKSNNISDADLKLNERNLARFLKTGVFQDIIFVH